MLGIQETGIKLEYNQHPSYLYGKIWHINVRVVIVSIYKVSIVVNVDK